MGHNCLSSPCIRWCFSLTFSMENTCSTTDFLLFHGLPRPQPDAEDHLCCHHFHKRGKSPARVVQHWNATESDMIGTRRANERTNIELTAITTNQPSANTFWLMFVWIRYLSAPSTAMSLTMITTSEWNVSASCTPLFQSNRDFLAATVCHTFFTMFPSYHHGIFRSYYQWPG